MEPISMSLVLPCYNAADTLAHHLPLLIEHLNSSGIVYEIIVVDDGSQAPDKVADLCSKHRVKLLVHPVNRGKGAAIKTGVKAALGAYILFTDCDVPFGYHSVTDMLTAMIQHRSDVSLVARKESGYRQSASRGRNVGSRVFGIVVKCIFMRDLGDTQCGLKGFSHRAAHVIFSRSRLNGFAADVEWLYLASRLGLHPIKVAGTLQHRGSSSVSLLRHSLPMLLDLLRVRWWSLTGFYKQAHTQ